MHRSHWSVCPRGWADALTLISGPFGTLWTHKYLKSLTSHMSYD